MNKPPSHSCKPFSISSLRNVNVSEKNTPPPLIKVLTKSQQPYTGRGSFGSFNGRTTLNLS